MQTSFAVRSVSIHTTMKCNFNSTAILMQHGVISLHTPRNTEHVRESILTVRKGSSLIPALQQGWKALSGPSLARFSTLLWTWYLRTTLSHAWAIWEALTSCVTVLLLLQCIIMVLSLNSYNVDCINYMDFKNCNSGRGSREKTMRVSKEEMASEH